MTYTILLGLHTPRDTETSPFSISERLFYDSGVGASISTLDNLMVVFITQWLGRSDPHLWKKLPKREIILPKLPMSDASLKVLFLLSIYMAG